MRRWKLSLILACALSLPGQGHVPLKQANAFELKGLADTGAQPGAQTASPATGLDLQLPLEAKSVRFAVIGDSGTGQHEQYEVAERMELYRERVNFDFVIMLGDNIYGGHQPDDFRKKFEAPYRVLLDAGVKFYAALGNHDDPNNERLYKPFNMG